MPVIKLDNHTPAQHHRNRAADLVVFEKILNEGAPDSSEAAVAMPADMRAIMGLFHHFSYSCTTAKRRRGGPGPTLSDIWVCRRGGVLPPARMLQR